MLVQDVEFLHGCSNPTLIVIHQDVNGRHIKTHEINMRDKEFMKIAWKQDNVETEATMLIPVPSPLGKCRKAIKCIINHSVEVFRNRGSTNDKCQNI